MRYFIFLFACMLMFNVKASAQNKLEPWNSKQLMEADVLASRIKNSKTANLLILSIGPDATIKGSVGIGPAGDQENIEKLKNYLKKVPKKKEVVLYCGCCPFAKCPNIRPAFRTLTELGFKNPKLLNLPKNIKTDWLDKDFPVND